MQQVTIGRFTVVYEGEILLMGVKPYFPIIWATEKKPISRSDWA